MAIRKEVFAWAGFASDVTNGDFTGDDMWEIGYYLALRSTIEQDLTLDDTEKDLMEKADQTVRDCLRPLLEALDLERLYAEWGAGVSAAYWWWHL